MLYSGQNFFQNCKPLTLSKANIFKIAQQTLKLYSDRNIFQNFQPITLSKGNISTNCKPITYI